MTLDLIRWEPGFYTDFYRQSSDGELYGNMSDGFPKTLEQCKEMVAGFAISDDAQSCMRAIVVDGRIAGCIGAFFETDVYRKNAELAYWIGRDFRGRGITTRAIRQFVDDLFSQYDIVRVYARPFAYNSASRRVLEKAGFTLEGIMRGSICKNGEIHDGALYALLRQ